jgi:hypothetical protein
MKEWQKFSLYVGVFLAAYLVPFSNPAVETAILESFKMLGIMRGSMSYSVWFRPFYRRGDSNLCIPRGCSQVLRSSSQKMGILFRCLSFRNCPGGMFLYGIAAFCRNL